MEILMGICVQKKTARASLSKKPTQRRFKKLKEERE